MSTPQLPENKTAVLLINLFSGNDIDSQIKRAKMPSWMTSTREAVDGYAVRNSDGSYDNDMGA